ncbi:mitochondrial aspartate-glutamate transporter AGC1 isoform X2 [Vicia villosa]|uniref:mitochondrial aspartate-glutamate transporter AGC1 isoform X2 n=1 Tax=Vicia villosa TaxID=3911 RepID=UPI00273C4D16|nr:mitochondrial aspartate-glutamate transporter AGC1 isoform X2 [Vicia villosa]
MSGCNKSPKNVQHSVKYWSIQDGVISSKVDPSRVDCSPSLSYNENKQCCKYSRMKSPEILTTPQLISAIRHLWDSASRPLSFLLPKENVNRDYDDKGFSKDEIISCVHKRNGVVNSDTTNYYSVNPGATRFGSQILQEKLDFPTVTQKMLMLKSSYGNRDYIHSLFQRVVQAHDKNSNEYCNEKELGSKDTEPENLENSSLVARDCISIDTSTTSLVKESDVCDPVVLIHEASSLSNDEVPMTKEVNPLCSDYFLQAVPDNRMEDDACRTLSSSIYADYHINGSLATSNSASVQCQYKIDDNELMEIQRRNLLDISDNERKVQIFSANHKQASHFLAKQEHAFSGAMAGVCVSCCLHPVDTIKTVIQSCRAEQRSIFYIGKSIVSDRGFPGLYRGITTNIACSAPISAVYTFTYESVKAVLLPYLPKVYYSFAHCVGGGCASIATSFIFTPSERIKQQMQIGSHYRNCWDALVGIIRNGGLYSLYAGWKAVLCRNIPHSMIKFYTYESLKQVMPSSSIQSHTLQTLVCGGLAGSTAALFTTPFDVIKTRLQTQIPGSRNQYDSVFHALYKISKTEGLKGLYRGLTPRLIMYMSQGSLFFASYEFFKSVFSLESPLPTGL